jgi:hypothetical protein
MHRVLSTETKTVQLREIGNLDWLFRDRFDRLLDATNFVERRHSAPDQRPSKLSASPPRPTLTTDHDERKVCVPKAATARLQEQYAHA